MFEDVQIRRKGRRRIFFARDSVCLQGLSESMEKVNRRELVLWTFECVQAPLARLKELHPGETRPETALEICRAWAQGDLRMPIARRAILDCHAASRDLEDMESVSLCHAVGQGLSAIHTPKHAIGLAIYELTAIVYREGDDYMVPVMERIEAYLKALEQVRGMDAQYRWIDFLCPKKGKGSMVTRWTVDS